MPIAGFEVKCPFCDAEADVWEDEFYCHECQSWTEEGEWIEWE